MSYGARPRGTPHNRKVLLREDSTGSHATEREIERALAREQDRHARQHRRDSGRTRSAHDSRSRSAPKYTSGAEREHYSSMPRYASDRERDRDGYHSRSSSFGRNEGWRDAPPAHRSPHRRASGERDPSRDYYTSSRQQRGDRYGSRHSHTNSEARSSSTAGGLSWREKLARLQEGAGHRSPSPSFGAERAQRERGSSSRSVDKLLETLRKEREQGTRIRLGSRVARGSDAPSPQRAHRGEGRRHSAAAQNDWRPASVSAPPEREPAYSSVSRNGVGRRNGASPAPTASSSGLSEDEYARLKQRNKEWKEALQRRAEGQGVRQAELLDVRRPHAADMQPEASPTHTEAQDEGKGAELRHPSRVSLWKVVVNRKGTGSQVFRMHPEDTIAKLKQRIQRGGSLPVSRQVLCCDSRPVDDTQALQNLQPSARSLQTPPAAEVPTLTLDLRELPSVVESLQPQAGYRGFNTSMSSGSSAPAPADVPIPVVSVQDTAVADEGFEMASESDDDVEITIATGDWSGTVSSDPETVEVRWHMVSRQTGTPHAYTGVQTLGFPGGLAPVSDHILLFVKRADDGPCLDIELEGGQPLARLKWGSRNELVGNMFYGRALGHCEMRSALGQAQLPPSPPLSPTPRPRRKSPGTLLLFLPVVIMVLALSLVWGDAPVTTSADESLAALQDLLYDNWHYLAAVASLMLVGQFIYLAPRNAVSLATFILSLLKRLLLFFVKQFRLLLGHLAKYIAYLLLDEGVSKPKITVDPAS